MRNTFMKSIMIILFTIFLTACGSKEPLSEDVSAEITIQGLEVDINENVTIGTLLSRNITISNVTVPLTDITIALTGAGSEDFNVTLETGTTANSYLGKVALLHSLEGKGGAFYQLNATVTANGESVGSVSVKIHIIDIPQWTVVSMCDETNGTEPWITDGTEAGTKPLGNFNPLGDSSLRSIPAKMGDKIYIAMNIHDGNGTSLWESDGTKAGTTLVKDINLTDNREDMRNLITVGDTLFFSAYGKELWVSDGTDTGTKMIKDINASEIHSFASYHDKLYFIASKFATLSLSRVRVALSSADYTVSLWESDGTSAGTKVIQTIPAVSNKPRGLAFIGDTLYLGIGDSGTATITIKKADMTQTPLVFEDDNMLTSSGLRWMGRYKEKLTLIVINLTGDFHSSIWVKEEGAYSKLPLDIEFEFGNIQLFDGLFLFSTFRSATEMEEMEEIGSRLFMQLWKSDTTEDGSVMIKESLCADEPM